MAWYLRKAFRLGPLLRLNVSKSGLGASFGIKGLRVGTGPRGAYLHAGRGGLYYRQSLSGRGSASRVESEAPELDAIDSHEVEQLTSAETEDALSAYNDVLARSALTPWILILAGVCGAVFVATEASASWMWTGVALLLVLLLAIAVPRDRARLHYAVEYELTPDQASAYDRLGQAFDEVAGCARVWHVAAEGSTGDRRKYHAGAGSLVNRTAIRPARRRPRRLRSALAFPTLEAGSQTLHFMPDCLLVLEGRRAGALGYSDVRGHTSTTRFIESGDPPPDSRVVGQTWEYVNKDGGPDRRFASNRELAVCEYGQLRLASDAGLTEEFQASRTDVFPAFIAAIRGMAQVAPHEERAPRPTAGAPTRFTTRTEYEAWKAERVRPQPSGAQGEQAKLAGRSSEPGGWPGDRVPRSRQELEQVRV
jgi:Protein of unknown function (DUF4236)